MELREQMDALDQASSWSTAVAPSSTAQQTALDRGRQVLDLLQRQALAARLDAQIAQLRSAIARAQAGDSSILDHWLSQFDHQSQWLIQPASTQPVSTLDQVGLVAVPSETALEEGWSNYLAHARQRLAELGQPSRSPWQTLDDQTDDHCSPRTSLPATAILDDELTSDLLTSDLLLGDSRGNQRPSDGKPSAPGGPIVDDDDSAAHSGALALADDKANDDSSQSAELDSEALLELGAVAEQVVDSSQPKKRVWGSLTFSLIGHAILFAALGTITYQHEEEVASLGSQVLTAVEARYEEPDLGAELEMIEPEQANLEPLASQPTVAPSTELSSLSTAALSTTEITAALGSASATNSIAAALSGSGAGQSVGGAGGGRGGGRGGGAPKLGGQFFGVGSGGNYFCYVVDSSGSMRGTAWESAKKELMRSLMTLQPTQQFYIVFFASEMHAIPAPGSDQPATHGLLATRENIDHARRWIESVQLSRGGPPTEALAWAIEREPDAIYLLTDGVTKVDVCGFVRNINHTEDIISGRQIRVPIHPIAYHSLDGQQLMRQLAQENKGQFHYVPASPKR